MVATTTKVANGATSKANGYHHTTHWSAQPEIYDLGTENGRRLRKGTDHSRWRMQDIRGVQKWHYLEDDEQVKAWPQTLADKYYMDKPLGLPNLSPPKTPRDSINNCIEFFHHLQLSSGHWGCEYGGPMFLLPGMTIAWYVTETSIPWYVATEMKNYIFARQNRDDGGWGLHTEGDSSVFGTTMNYTALRIFGVSEEDPRMVKARGLLQSMGGATYGPHWLKWWLAVMNVGKWEMVNPVPAELWLLPEWVPFAPWRWWIHMRQVFLAMSFAASRRWQCKTTPLILSLRKELFTQDYATLNWDSHRNTIHARDNYHAKSWIVLVLFWIFTNILPYFRWIWKDRAEAWAWKLIEMEDKNTDYCDLAPVNSAMNFVACYIHDGPGSYSVRRHIERLPEHNWMTADGMLTSGTNGTQCWDISFFILAAVEAGLAEQPKWRPMLTRALEFLDDQQIRENVPDQDKCYRQQRKGAWAFSNKDQGYAVSDCVSEALKSVLQLQRIPGYPTLIDDQRIFDAIDTLLTYQNKSGGCASYEPTRGSEHLEVLNAAEVFGRIMVEYDYPECTTAVVTALSMFIKYYPNYRSEEIKAFKDRAVAYIRRAQHPDGSWYGSWGICFTYAGMFALESLASVGEYYETSEYSRKGCDFFISKQREDGGWSECYKSCEEVEYIEHPSGSQVVMTAWACLGLLAAKYPHKEPLERAMKFLMSRQQPNGEWLQEALEGVFNKTCGISYPNYKFIFPMKALGKYAKRFGDDPLF